uniref:Uncharacterized protein n=1 Tax=Rhizophora mucronata TaxID=61149 RepID=A0A2P2QK27_RHIMU
MQTNLIKIYAYAFSFLLIYCQLLSLFLVMESYWLGIDTVYFVQTPCSYFTTDI